MWRIRLGIGVSADDDRPSRADIDRWRPPWLPHNADRRRNLGYEWPETLHAGDNDLVPTSVEFAG